MNVIEKINELENKIKELEEIIDKWIVQVDNFEPTIDSLAAKVEYFQDCNYRLTGRVCELKEKLEGIKNDI